VLEVTRQKQAVRTERTPTAEKDFHILKCLPPDESGLQGKAIARPCNQTPNGTFGRTTKRAWSP